MTPKELQQALQHLGLARDEFGRLVGAPARTAFYWCSASGKVAPIAAVIASLLIRRPELVEVLRQMADEREAKGHKPKKGKTR